MKKNSPFSAAHSRFVKRGIAKDSLKGGHKKKKLACIQYKADSWLLDGHVYSGELFDAACRSVAETLFKGMNTLTR